MRDVDSLLGMAVAWLVLLFFGLVEVDTACGCFGGDRNRNGGRCWDRPTAAAASAPRGLIARETVVDEGSR